ncbi:YihY/virulence factor BrkB family protein [Candidatus Woesearchaeota archaeon]|nr:YihY/virulence factor BrkB family protein [Candidatus Woesearchaeota archaeon]
MEIKKRVADVAKLWKDRRIPLLASSLSFFLLFIIGPFVAALLLIVDIFFDAEIVETELFTNLSSIIGEAGVGAMKALVASALKIQTAFVFEMVGVIVLVITASMLFSNIESSLELIIEHKRAKRSMRKLAVQRLLGLLFTFVSAAILIAMIFVSSLLHGINKSLLAAGFLGFVFLLLAAMYYNLSDRHFRLKNVWGGAFLSTSLLTIMAFLLSLYLRYFPGVDAYSVAGSLLLLMTWLYFSSLIFLTGAAYIAVRAKRMREKDSVKA